MKDRLIELLTAFEMDVRLRCPKYEAPTCEGCQYDLDHECDKTAILTEYLLANGVIVPPCKVGDSCYPLPRSKKPIVERKVSRITISARNTIIGYYENDGQWRPPLRTRTLGIDVFLTKEEAEKELERSKK